MPKLGPLLPRMCMSKFKWYWHPIVHFNSLYQCMQCISKNRCGPGRMAASERMHSIRAVRDTQAGNYSAPDVDTTRRVAFGPPIAISPFVLPLSVSYFKQTIWRCGQLWPYVGLGSLVTRFHRDCKAMHDTAKISPCVPFTLSSRRARRTWEDMILPRREDPWSLGKRELHQKLGKIEGVFLLNDKMRWKWDSVYLLRKAHSTSITWVSPYTHRRSITIYLESVINQDSWCTGKPWSSEFGDALAGHDCANLQAVIDRVWRCTWMPWSCELPGHNRASLEIHLEAVIKRAWRYALRGHDRANLQAVIDRVWWFTVRSWSSLFGDALGGWDRVNSEDALAGRDRLSVEMHSEAVTEGDWRCTCRLWLSEIGGVHGGGQFGGRPDGSWDSIHWLTCNCGNAESWVQHPPRDEKLAGSGRLSILGWCCTWCMPYSVLTHDYGMER